MKLKQIVAIIADELAPTPYRLQDASGLTAVVLLTVFFCMALQIPEAGLSCYLLFFAWRDNSADALFTGVKLIIAGSGAVLLANVILQLVVNDPMMRLLALCLFTFIGMYLANATQLGELASTAGFIFAFILTLYDIVPLAEAVSIGLQWIWLVLVMPMLVLVAWAVFVGRRPLTMAKFHLQSLQTALQTPHTRATRLLLDQGLAPADTYLGFAKLMGQVSRTDAQSIAEETDAAYFALALAEANIPQRPTQGASPPDRQRFFKKDILKNPSYVRFGFKVTIAAFFTYAFYTVFDMFGIHTAMITCYFVSLGTSGATRHKMMLRILGCLIGAFAGWIAMLTLVPLATDIGGLLVIITLPTFIAAWLSLGSERISYAGWQMSLCFNLILLSGFSPPTSFSAGTDRIIGILVGCTAILIVFTLLWPENAKDELAASLDELEEKFSSTYELNSGREISRLRMPLAEAREHAQNAVYEAGSSSWPAVDAAYARYLSFLRKSFHATK